VRLRGAAAGQPGDRARGFQPVSLGAPVLRVEAAIAAALAELALLHRLVQTGYWGDKADRDPG
jgi:hypothetical protein